MMRSSTPQRGSRSLATLCAIVGTTTLGFGAPGAQAPGPGATQSVIATATFGAWASVRVSTQRLQFHVTDSAIPGEASVDFEAGARASANGDVVLIVEADRSADPATTTMAELTIAGGSAGVIAGAVPGQSPTTVARWTGGGLRTGRVTFRLRAAPGSYQVPVRFALSVR